MTHGELIGAAALVVALGGPLLFGLAGVMRAWRERAPAAVAGRWDWRLTTHSALLYTLAFNIVFFIQELFLVVPKALTPGLRPTLYHNNHRWAGDHPLEALFQGTGAVAIFLAGLIFALLVRRGAGGTPAMRLFFIWMAYHGLFQSLPQIVVGAIVPENDFGMAMDYLALSPAAKTVAALAALTAIVAVGLWLVRPLLALADSDALIETAGRRARFILNAATVPALAAIPLIILFRVPREVIEVVVPPIAVTIVGIAWIQAGSWWVRDVRARPFAGRRALLGPALAALGVLLFFHLVLRPGVDFF
jgi:hypothetical protein